MSEQGRIHRISAHSFAEKYSRGKLENALLLDVREPREWEVYHLDGTTLIPLHILPGMLDHLDPEQPVYVFCAHGIRSLQAVQWLYECGFRQVFHVDGGLAEVMLYLEGRGGGEKFKSFPLPGMEWRLAIMKTSPPRE